MGTLAATFVVTYYQSAIVQTVSHRLFGYKKRVMAIYAEHTHGHHARYARSDLLRDDWVPSGRHVLWYFAVPFSAIAALVWAMAPSRCSWRTSRDSHSRLPCTSCCTASTTFAAAYWNASRGSGGSGRSTSSTTGGCSATTRSSRTGSTGFSGPIGRLERSHSRTDRSREYVLEPAMTGIATSRSRVRAAVVALLGFAALSGCVSPGVYPEEWAERVRVEPGHCPDLDGEYWNDGESFDGSGKGVQRRETRFVHVLKDAATFDADPHDRSIIDWKAAPYRRFSMQRTSGLIHVTATKEDGATLAYDLAVIGECRESLLYVRKSGWQHGEFTSSQQDLSLGRAADGSLLVRFTARAVAWLLVPVTEWESQWTRYAAVGAEPMTELFLPAEIPPADH